MRTLTAMLIGALLAVGTMAILMHYATMTRPAPAPAPAFYSDDFG
jgi:hypothetical protein